MVHWDIDRYEHLVDSAWALDGCANEQDRRASRDGDRSEGGATRVRARLLRESAAALLAQYWVLPGTAR